MNGRQNNLGEGTIVVDGNINIQADTYYWDTAIDNIYNIAAVAWIATGTITIGPNVSRAVGAHIALGTSNHGTINTFIIQPSNLQLELVGLVLAQKFNFGRSIVGTNSQSKPAEQIIYDSRLFTNPSPGLEDLTKGLPTMQ